MPLISTENPNSNHRRSPGSFARIRRRFTRTSRTFGAPGQYSLGPAGRGPVGLRPGASLLPSALPQRPHRRVIAGFAVAASAVIVGTIAAAANASEPPAVHIAAANDQSVLPLATFTAQVDQLRIVAAGQAAQAAAVQAAQAEAQKAAAAAAEPQPTGPSFTGLASWYGDEGFDNRTTASGAIFRADGFTAASRTLPFGTKLRVCRASTCVDVVVTDRGPYVDGRVLDLSRGAARVLGMLSAGVAEVTATPVA